MADWAEITNWEQRGMEYSLIQHYTQPRSRAWINTMVYLNELVYADFVELIEKCNFLTAEGIFLDLYGLLVREPRGSMVDDDYRGVISAKIAAIQSACTVDEIYRIWSSVTLKGLSHVMWESYSPSTVWLGTQFADTETVSGETKARIVRIMRFTKPLGIGMILFQYPETYFGFEEDATATGWDEEFMELIE